MENIDLAREVMAHPERFPDRFVVIPLDGAVTARILSRERVRILRFVRRRGPFPSVGALAARLGRVQTRVGRDLGDPARAGLIEIGRHGGSKAVKAARRAFLISRPAVARGGARVSFVCRVAASPSADHAPAPPAPA